ARSRPPTDPGEGLADGLDPEAGSQRPGDLSGSLSRSGWSAALAGVCPQGRRAAAPERNGERQAQGDLGRPGARPGGLGGVAGGGWATTTNLRPSTAARDADYVRRYI